jgi:acetoin utilization protein AcuC
VPCSPLVIWDDAFTEYDFGPEHPLRPVRLELTMALAGQLGVLDGADIVAPIPADDATLQLTHDPAYIAAVRAAPADFPRRLAARYGLGNGDNPIFDRMHEAAALVTGASVQAAAAVWEGRAEHAVNISGGLHHAMRDHASGFCVYDDPAVAIAWLLAHGAQRVAYVDLDVHHGDGVQASFYDDPRVLTVSLHETGRTLFPGTGFPDETGDGEGRGTSINVALPPGTADAGWLRAVAAVVPGALRAFRPEILVTQHGCDTHELDPLAHLDCTVDGQVTAYRWMHALAHELTGGKWVALGGGGYDWARVVPRAWTHLIATACGRELSGPTPDDWQALVAERAGREGFAPQSLSDGVLAEWEPWVPAPEGLGDGVDAAIAVTRMAAFPLLGLDPLTAPAGPPALR